MKRVRCPQCSQPVSFDETKYAEGGTIVLTCNSCGKRFGIRKSAPKPAKQEQPADGNLEEGNFGTIIVIENVFHYKQELPLRLGVNKIGRYQKNNPINVPIMTDDPSVDLLHCTITVSRNKNNKLKYVLKDGPSFTGTFVDNEILGDHEMRIIEDGQMFTIGATSILLQVPKGNG